MKPAIGLQLWSVRNSLEKDYIWTLEKIAEVGYQYLELITTVTSEGLVFGKDMRAPELRKNLDRYGLRAVGCHFMPNEEMRWETILADLQVLGVDSLACAIAFFKDRHEFFHEALSRNLVDPNSGLIVVRRFAFEHIIDNALNISGVAG